MAMKIDDKNGNGNEKEWETTCIGMGIGLYSHGNKFPSADAVLGLYTA